MGMLGRIASAVGDAGMAYGAMKLKQISEEELLDKKAAIDKEREARILEANAKLQEIANIRADGIRKEDHVWKNEDAASAEALALAREGRHDAHDEKMAKAGYGHSERLQQAGFDNAKPVQDAQIAASSANVEQSQAGTAKANEDLKVIQTKNELLRQYNEESDARVKAVIADKIAVASGKSPELIKSMEIGTNEINKLTGVENKRSVLVDLSDINNPQILNVQPQWNAQHPKPLSDSDIDALATEKTVKELGVRNTTYWDTKGDVDNSGKYDAALEANRVKIRNGGMLNQSSDNDKPVSKNNLGNIKDDNGNFLPSKGIDSDIGKIDHQLKIYGTGESAHTDGGDISLRKLFSIYAPAKDRNDPVQYAKNVAVAFGDKFSIDTPVDLTDQSVRQKIIPFIIKQEGNSKVTPEIQQAIDNLSKKEPATASNSQSWDIDKDGKPYRVR